MEPKAMAKRVIDEIWDKGNLAVVDELIAPNWVNHDPQATDEMKRGVDGYKAQVKMQREATPDMHCKAEQILVDGDFVVTRWTANGTNTGPIMGMDPTNKKIAISGISIDRVQNGKVVETWGQMDALGMLQQLGFVPKGPPSPAKRPDTRPNAK